MKTRKVQVSYSIVIPSRNLGNLTACIDAIRAVGETARVIVVWDMREPIGSDKEAWKALGEVTLAPAITPWCFARAANIGIRAAGTDDVLLCNDDVLLETRHGFATLSRSAHAAGLSALSPRIKGPAHPVHQFSGHLRSTISDVAFVPFCCVYLTRQALNYIGLLDEQFVPGGCEDDDWCRRAKSARLRIGVCNSVVVDHQTLPHTFRPEGKPDLYDLEANRKRFEEKWRRK